MRLLLAAITACAACYAQLPNPAGTDLLDLARMKNYSSARVSSGNRFVASNDDSKRVMPGETLVMADLQGAGMITHIWLTVASNEFGWPRLLRLQIYYDGHKHQASMRPWAIFSPWDMAPSGM
jgi:D-arabinan exo alpha-(1,3)/(1,5)-arabinofuranosidase (non-reducing end)